MLAYVIIVIIGLFIIIKVNSPEYKGKSGEKLVAERLNIINGYKYIFNNIILNVKLYNEYKEYLIKDEICPRCHGKLVKRKGKRGEFYGCSNFPKCKYTKDIENIKYYEVLK